MKILIVKFFIKHIIKALNKKFNLRNIKEYVEDDNELDIKMKKTIKRLKRNTSNIEDLEKEIKKLKKDSHPPQEYICCRKCGCRIAKTKWKR